MRTVLSLTRSCDRLDLLRFVAAADRGIYPSSAAVACLGKQAAQLAVEVQEQGDARLIRLRGELDLATEPELRERLRSVG